MKRLTILSAIILVLGACSREPVGVELEAGRSPEVQPGLDPGRPGIAFVKLTQAAAEEMEEGLAGGFPEGLNVKSVSRIFPDGGKFEARHKAAGLDRWYQVVYSPTVSATKASEDISSMNGIESISFPVKTQACSFFNDPYLPKQWNLYNDGSLGKYYQSGSDCNVLPVWQEFTTGSSNVLVAVIDEGIDPEHEDLKGMVIPPGEHGSKCFVNKYEGYTIYPGEHGNNVASIIGAVSDNGKGISGIAGGSDGTGGVKILGCQILHGKLSADQVNEAQAFVWAADNGAVIVNNSWSYIFSTEKATREYYNEYFAEGKDPVKDAIDYFVENAGYDENGVQTGPMAGGLVVFSCGNDGYQASCPSMYEKVLSVAAHGASFNFASYSNYGDWVDIVAPGGEDLYYPSHAESILGAELDNEYCGMIGTSQAAPHVSGVAALLVSHFGGPGFTNEMLWDRLIGGAKVGTLTGEMTGPMLDAYGAFTYKRDAKITISTTYKGDYTLKSHESETISFTIKGNTLKKLPVTVEANCAAISSSITSTSVTLNIDALKEQPGKYPVKIVVGKGTSEETSFSFDLTILENHAPVCVGTLEDQVLDVENKKQVNLYIGRNFTDEDEETLSYYAEISDNTVASIQLDGSSLKILPKDYGTATIKITAQDARKATATHSFQVVARNGYSTLDVYPNPVSSTLYIRPSGTSNNVSVEILTPTGAKVLSKTGTHGVFQPMAIDVSNLTPGQYLVKISIDGAEPEIKPIVKI